MNIKDIPTNWRDKFVQAQFRWAIFFVETDARGGGRRVALHEYPKRNVPYAEDMGRAAMKFQVQGYLIGRQTGGGRNAPGRFGPGQEDQYFGGAPAQGEANEEVKYLDLKKNLIECLEQDGPGRLRLPLPHMAEDLMVMVQTYTITESRERGGMCTVEMTFVEYGDPHYRSTVSTTGDVQQAAANVEDTVAGPGAMSADDASRTADQVAAYVEVHNDADVGNFVPNLDDQQAISSGLNY